MYLRYSCLNWLENVEQYTTWSEDLSWSIPGLFFHHFGAMTHTPGNGNFSVNAKNWEFFSAFGCIVKT